MIDWDVWGEMIMAALLWFLLGMAVSVVGGVLAGVVRTDRAVIARCGRTARGTVRLAAADLWRGAWRPVWTSAPVRRARLRAARVWSAVSWGLYMSGLWWAGQAVGRAARPVGRVVRRELGMIRGGIAADIADLRWRGVATLGAADRDAAPAYTVNYWSRPDVQAQVTSVALDRM